MSCERCGSPSNGRLCADCEQMDRVERNNEHMMNDGGSVAVEEATDSAVRQPESRQTGDRTDDEPRYHDEQWLIPLR